MQNISIFRIDIILLIGLDLLSKASKGTMTKMRFFGFLYDLK
jgi:hypothetical protein